MFGAFLEGQIGMGGFPTALTTAARDLSIANHLEKVGGPFQTHQIADIEWWGVRIIDAFSITVLLSPVAILAKIIEKNKDTAY